MPTNEFRVSLKSTTASPVIALLLASGVAGCSSALPPVAAYAPGEDAVREPWEIEVLAALPKLPPGKMANVSGRRVTPSAPYPAASGQRCMPVNVADDRGSRDRLACERDQRWHFVADVFSTDHAARATP